MIYVASSVLINQPVADLHRSKTITDNQLFSAIILLKLIDNNNNTNDDDDDDDDMMIIILNDTI